MAYQPHDSNRALLFLAGSPAGATEAILLAHGCAPEVLAELVRDGHATAQADRGRAGIRVVRLRITESGRRALASGTVAADARREQST